MALRRRLLTSVLLTLALATGVAGPTATPATAAPAPTTGWRFLDVSTHDGVKLKANLIAPTTPGPHPAIVFVSSWGLNDAQYLAQAKTFAQSGYVVLSYTTRGFWGSGGQVETAGPADIADVSAVIDWLVANTDTDPARIGVGGVSYGAGISLIAAGHDRRIRAVVAMSAWTDLVASLYGDQTRRPQAVLLLRAAAQLLGRPSAEFNRVADDYFANRNVPGLIEWGELRSARTYLAGLNANAPAVLMANAYGDSMFPPNQLVDFFAQLTGPKRLELAPGDHAIPELTGLAGIPNHVWTSTRRWFDEHLAGVDTGISAEPVVLRVRNAGGTVESYPDWAGVTGSSFRYHLGDVPWWDRTGPLSPGPSSGWTESFRATGDTVATGGVVMLTNGLEALTGIPPVAWLPAVDRGRSAVWSTGALPRGAAVRGIPKLHLTVKPAAAAGTLVSYLYDVDTLGTGQLVTHAPFSWTTARPGALMTVDTALPATAWNVPAGHRLALVVDTKDPLYLDWNPYGATVSVTGGSWLDVPLK
ncbi:CocE/NonD family hydrolase [Micromonospora sp. NPDC049679]|uniref:CocE/NonD family hydrolase n=1 Tax=Micromonospora sp. NPDC049679 TaxID=3155920 RepID=UPI0033ECC530